MPSEKILELKKQQVQELKEAIGNAVTGVLVDYKGITVAEDTQLRKDLREAGVKYMVVKNTMLTLAFTGTALEGLNDKLEGTTALAISSEDYVAAAKILCKFADKHKTFSVKGGFLDGGVISVDKVDSLAKLPSREILLATVVYAFQAPIASLARALQAVVDKNGEAAPAAEEAPAQTEAPAEEAPAETAAE
ncbi:MAG: 50S ribosomal protein L10 [Oscillospiraceae bacterium]|nr:50S ribosomal protein L10 [Oscillospiraceae bacterium]